MRYRAAAASLACGDNIGVDCADCEVSTKANRSERNGVITVLPFCVETLTRTRARAECRVDGPSDKDSDAGFRAWPPLRPCASRDAAARPRCSRARSAAVLHAAARRERSARARVRG